MNVKRLQKQGEVDMDNALDASPTFTKSKMIDSRKKNDCSKTRNNQSSENQTNTSGNESSRLVPSCCVIFDLEPFLFDFIFSSEIFKSFPCLSLSSLPSCDLMS
ncbi:hypothetical protein Tco_0820333 [Tanacetum coccineum]|uniref:Uncharacterized protein n=1 Tax=Tanacetum coccineum TaxID=301880 RepID=A0ABQ5AAT8_9ASTR